MTFPYSRSHSDLGEFYHPFCGRQLCGKPVKLVECLGRVDGPPGFGGLEGAGGNPHLLAVGEIGKGFGISRNIADIQELCHHGAGTDRRHRDVPAAKFLVQPQGEGGHIGLCGGVHRHPGGGTEGGDGGDVQNPAAADHIGDCHIGDNSQCPYIQVYHPGLGAVVHVPHIAQIPAAGAVHQQRHLREVLRERFPEGDKTHGITEVQRHTDHRLIRQILFQFFQTVRPAGDEPVARDLRKEAGKLADKFPPEAGGCAGDNGGFHHGPLLKIHGV